MTAPKLTKAQREALRCLGLGSSETHDPDKCDDLRRMRLVECLPVGRDLYRYTITDAGRAALKDGGK